jgi:altronate dehydratase large subunit
MGFLGYPRADGSAGVRNHVAVVSTVVCANGVVDAIARAVPEVKTITHTEGCGRGPADVIVAVRTLAGVVRNPNVAAVLLVGLGCEFITREVLVSAIGACGKPVETISIQEEGGSLKAARRGAEIARGLVAQAAAVARQECGWEKLTLGLKCGGSDALSGVTANPLVGVAADWLVGQGGGVILSETTELIGTETVLARRAANPATAQRLTAMIRDQHARAKAALGSLAEMVISPGNMDGGLSNIREKALGGVVKGGSSPICKVVDYAEPPRTAGLVVMDAPGSDIFCLTAMAAGGAQIIVFTTGRGTPAGSPIAPVVKIASNSRLFAQMKDDMDVNAGRIADGATLADAGRELIDFVQRVASGEPTKAERNRNDLFAIHTTGPSF